MEKILKTFKRLFKKEPEREFFRQTCVFAHSELEGDVRLFKMQSGNIYLARLEKIDSEGISWGADDTAQRNLTWEIIDKVVESRRNVDDLNDILIFEKHGEYKIPMHCAAASKSEAEYWKAISDSFTREFYPEQYKKLRFLRG